MQTDRKTKKVIRGSKFDFRPDAKHMKIAATAIGFDAKKYILAVSNIPEIIRDRTSPPQMDEQFDYEIIEIQGASPLRHGIRNEKMAFHFLQPVQGDKFLLASARTSFRNGNPEKNARIFDNAGTCISEFVLGDGLQSVKVTADNHIWASYFDEGIYGSYGWDKPLGYCGLRKWDISGNSCFEYNAQAYRKYIDDCYAMNVLSDSEVWFYFYQDFQIGILKDNKISFLEPGISGASCFLVHGQRVMFDKGYNQHGTFRVLKISGDLLEAEYDIVFEDPDGTRLIPQLIDYRGSEMVFVSNEKVYIYDFSEDIEEH